MKDFCSGELWDPCKMFEMLSSHRCCLILWPSCGVAILVFTYRFLLSIMDHQNDVI